MSRLTWDQVGQRFFETGCDRGVLYLPDSGGSYNSGYAWNGLTAVTESPSGGEPSPLWADNMKYLNLLSLEEFGATLEAFTYPDEFGECDGSSAPEPGVLIGQQSRRSFGLCYRTRVGNDVDADDLGYKLHLVYGCLAAPSEKAYNTVNDSPEATTFSWEISTTPVEVGTIGGKMYKPTASIVIDSTKVSAASLAELEDFLYGTEVLDPMMPSPAAVVAIFEGDVTVVAPEEPTFDAMLNEITIPTVTGVIYKIDGMVVTGVVPITEDTLVKAEPDVGYKFPDVTATHWFFAYSA